MSKKIIVWSAVGGVGAFMLAPQIKARLYNPKTGESPLPDLTPNWQIGLGGAALGALAGWGLSR